MRPGSRTTRALAAVAVVAGLMLGATGGGAADAGARGPEQDAATSRAVVVDGVDDVWGIGEDTDNQWALVDMPTADVQRVMVSHKAHRIRVRMAFDDLRRVDPQVYAVWFHHRGYLATAFVVARQHTWEGRNVLTEAGDDVVPCARLRHDLDYAHDRLVMSVPRACLGRPPWVRVGMRNFLTSLTSADLEEVCDNPFSDQAFSRERTRPLHHPEVP
jgi:hypothetical protein